MLKKILQSSDTCIGTLNKMLGTIGPHFNQVMLFYFSIFSNNIGTLFVICILYFISLTKKKKKK